jgi:hypothetical protein
MGVALGAGVDVLHPLRREPLQRSDADFER